MSLSVLAKTDPILYVSADPREGGSSITVAHQSACGKITGFRRRRVSIESVDALISTVHGEVEDGC